MADAPVPLGLTTIDELVEQLEALRQWANLSYRDVHKRVLRLRAQHGVVEEPSFNTVYRCFRRGRNRLDVELLVDVVTALLEKEDAATAWRNAYHAIIRRATAAGIVTVSVGIPVDNRIFVGRADEMSVLKQMTCGKGCIIVEGMAGIGKTQLVAEFARAALDRQDYSRVVWVDLYGYEPNRPPADSAAALDAILRALGEPAFTIGEMTVRQRSTKLRQLAQRHSLLIVLDNARSQAQIEPLVVGSATSTTIVTTRRQMPEVAGAQRLPLRPLKAPDAMDLVRRMIGANRADSEPIAIDRILERSGYIPLDLNIVASRISAQPDWTLDDHAKRLEAFPRDDTIRPALMTSNEALGLPGQRMLRLLAAHPGPNFGIQHAAVLLDTGPDDVAQILHQLETESLILRANHDRFHLHDVVRSFSTYLLLRDEPYSQYLRAYERLGWYLIRAATVAMDLAMPFDKDARPAVGLDGIVPDLNDADAAWAWLDLERDNLVAVGLGPKSEETADFSALMAAIIWRYMDARGHYSIATALYERALATSNTELRVQTLIAIGVSLARRGSRQDAVARFEEAVRVSEHAGLQLLHARALVNAGLAYKFLGKYDDARLRYERARVCFLELDDYAGYARATFNIGVVHEEFGEPDAALSHYRVAATSFEAIADWSGLAATLGSIGAVFDRQGKSHEALEYLHRALSLASAGDKHAVAVIRTDIATIYFKLGQVADARSHIDAAIETLEEIQHRSGLARALNRLGQIVAGTAPSEAVAAHARALEVALEVSLPIEEGTAHEGLGSLALRSGDTEEARAHWAQSLEIYDRLGLPERDQVQAQLDALSD